MPGKIILGVKVNLKWSLKKGLTYGKSPFILEWILLQKGGKQCDGAAFLEMNPFPLILVMLNKLGSHTHF